MELGKLAAVDRSDQGGATYVGDLGVTEAEQLEHLHPSSRQRRCTCRRRQRHEGGEGLVAERVAGGETLRRGQPPQGRREVYQPRVADASVFLEREA